MGLAVGDPDHDPKPDQYAGQYCRLLGSTCHQSLFVTNNAISFVGETNNQSCKRSISENVYGKI